MASSRETSFYSKSVTATSDGIFQIEDTGVILTSINIACYGQDAYWGNVGNQSSIIRANAVVWFDSPCRVCDLWFRNLVAGANTQIVVSGTIAGR